MWKLFWGVEEARLTGQNAQSWRRRHRAKRKEDKLGRTKSQSNLRNRNWREAERNSMDTPNQGETEIEGENEGVKGKKGKGERAKGE